VRLAVVVPALNEAAALPDTLQSLLPQARPADLVVDGGSGDDTVAVARRFGVDTLVAEGRGRGGQVASGLAACAEDVVVVAHADMLFPADALAAVEAYLGRHPNCPGGCLGHQFDRPGWAYRAIEWWDRRRAMRGFSYGDQAQFFRRAALEFPDLPLMEDVELARRLRRIGRPAYLDRPVTVSGRRYERVGWPRAMWANWRLRRLYRRDGAAACWRLYQDYYGRMGLTSPPNRPGP
jgi:glycosyltransferase involved in cell wall biosynthesis